MTPFCLAQACANYAWMVRHGAVPKALKCSEEKHLAHYQEAQEHNDEVNRAVKELLLVLEIPGEMRFWYYAFSRRLDRLCRIYSKKTLLMAAENLADLWEFKGLDPGVLDAIALCVFGIVLPEPETGSMSERTQKVLSAIAEPPDSSTAPGRGQAADSDAGKMAAESGPRAPPPHPTPCRLMDPLACSQPVPLEERSREDGRTVVGFCRTEDRQGGRR